MNEVHENFVKRLNNEIDSYDTEAAHSIADDILCEIAISAVKDELSLSEVEHLIYLYNRVPKWYA